MYYFSKYANVLDSLFYDPTHSFHKRHRVFNAVILTKGTKLCCLGLFWDLSGCLSVTV